MTAQQKAKLRLMGGVVALGCLVGPAFNWITDDATVDSATQGVVDGFLVSFALSAYVLFVRDGIARTWMRERTFATNLMINGTALLVLFLLMRGFGQVLTSGNPTDFTRSFVDTHLTYALPFVAVLAFGFQFILQMNRMVGTNVLRYFVTGAYHQPKEEERIFMFLDLASSTQMAEQLGSARYYRLLRRFVDDLSEPIVASKGEIYQYAGDEVVITWPLQAGLSQANCIRCFFRIRAAIQANAESYHSDFGVVPKFRAGLHGGKVTGGELGDLYQEIVFVGDILNTAARLEDYARQHQRELVVSRDLLAQLQLPDEFRAEELEEYRPRGKEKSVMVYALSSEVAPTT